MRKITKYFILLFIALLSFPVYGADERSFKADLSGSKVVQSVMTQAKGVTTFQTGKGGEELTYRLEVTDIENVTAAHIHQGKKGDDGPPVVNFTIKQKADGKFSGILSEGTITENDFMTLLKGKSLKSLIEMIETGETYVNVHTKKYPGGEIRGQIEKQVPGK